MTEAWLRGPVEGVPAELMPAAHALIDAREDVERSVPGLTVNELWLTPGGVASVGFHLCHVAGSIDRLLTYARGEALDPSQLAALGREKQPGSPLVEAEELLARLGQTIDRALQTYRATDVITLDEPRKVGRAGLPSTVRGLLFHAAEHTRRHAGQVVATAGIVRGLGLSS